ncbi:MAG TPA: UrcA family protein [Steroidobacteraceae bacterium]
MLGTAAACALLAGDVCARDKIATESYKVNTQGLDPSRPADAQTLYTRVSNAAWFVCVRGMRADLPPLDSRKGCYEKALGDAVRAINRPLITQMYLATHTLQEAAAHHIEVPEQVAAK